MKVKISIPSGWRKVRKGAFIHAGDRFLDEQGAIYDTNHNIKEKWKVGTTSYFIYK